MNSDASEWRDRLRDFALEHRGDLEIPDGHDLEGLKNWQRRVTGGVLLQFLDFVQSGKVYEHFDTALDDRPLHERLFLFITDLPGAVAAGELIQSDSEQALWILKEEWSAWLSDPATDDDETYDRHYEFWSVWHQNLQADWDVEDLDGVDYWVHEEGFALADRAGRGAQHLWTWDGEEMEKVEEAITSWSSLPTGG